MEVPKLSLLKHATMEIPKLSPEYLAESRASSIIAAGSVAIVLSSIAVLLRFVSRLVTTERSSTIWQKLWWDDWAILITLLFSHGFLVLNMVWTNYGLGKHFFAISLSEAVPNNNISHAAILMYAICIWLIKVSSLLLYYRIFKSSRKFSIALWIVGGIVTAWFCCTAIVPWFNCNPVSKTLNLFEPGECFDRTPWFISSAFLNAFFDLVILILPVPTIWRLQMTLRRRVSLLFVFFLGYSSAFLSFARFIIVARDPSLLSVEPSADATWRLVPLLILSMFEAPIAIMAICSPSIGQLVARATKERSFSSMFRSLFSTQRSEASGYSKVQVKMASGPGHSSTTAFASDDDSLDRFKGFKQEPVRPIPMGAIGVNRDVHVSRDLERGYPGSAM